MASDPPGNLVIEKSIKDQASVSQVNRSRETTRHTYNRLSRWYDLFAGTNEQAASWEGLKRLKIRKGEHVLEIGCGTGENLLSLANAVGQNGRVYGLDLSEGMLGVARSKLARANLQYRVDLNRGDAVFLPYGSETMETVFLAFTLELFDSPEIPLVLAESMRVLKPAGRIGVVSLSKRANPNWITRAYEWSHEKFPHLIDCRPISVLSEMQTAGFQLLQVSNRSLWGLPVDIVVGEKA